MMSFPAFPSENRVVDVYSQNVQEGLVVDGEDTGVDREIFEAVGDQLRSKKGGPCS